MEPLGDKLPKRVVGSLVRVLGLPLGTIGVWLLRLTDRRAGVVVVYHNVAEQTGDPRSELVAPHSASVFEEEMGHLARRYLVVDAGELPRAVAERRRGDRFPVAVTFDDDLPSHVDLALPALLRAGIPATFFLSGASLDRPFSFWWERLQRVVDEDQHRLEDLFAEVGAIAPAVVGKSSIHALGRHVEELGPEARDSFADSLDGGDGDPPDAGLRADGVRALAHAGMTIGFHTRRHHPLPTLDDRELAEAFTEGRSELEEVVGERLTVVCYPHGRADGRVAAAARQAGFRVGYTGRGRSVQVDDDVLLLGRIDPSYRSAGHFALQIVRALLRRNR